MSTEGTTGECARFICFFGGVAQWSSGDDSAVKRLRKALKAVAADVLVLIMSPLTERKARLMMVVLRGLI